MTRQILQEPNRLRDIWNEQEDYNRQVRARKPGSYEQWMEKYLLGVISEMNEVLDEINWKAHRQGRSLDRVNLARELADLTKYVISLWEWSGFTWDDMLFRVHEKSVELQQQWKQDFTFTIPEGATVVITDIDGTLADYRKGFLQWLAEYHIEDLPADNATTLMMEVDLGLSYPLYVKYKDEFEASGGYSVLPIYPDVAQTLQDLSISGVVILAYTARPARTFSRIWNDSWTWFMKNGVDTYIKELRIGKEQRVAKACELQEAGHRVVLIDDEPDTAIRASSAGIPVLLRKQPYNKGLVQTDLLRYFETLKPGLVYQAAKEEPNGTS
jgi:phosphoglycolate phosphatase-like HAD superfamily hydrolase